MQNISQTLLRSPKVVMKLSRMGSMFPTRLSFLRTLLRRLGQENAQVTRPVWEMSDDGYGHAVYSVKLGGSVYSLVAFANELDPEDRTDRVIATAWDSAYVLYDGVPDAEEISRLKANAPLQEAGRFTDRDLVLSRANKSVRLFDHVVTRLRAGQQPDRQLVARTGYLMRTTAVYGNGKFGIADRGIIQDRPGLDGPFMAEMLTVWLIRGFTHDLVEHIGGHPLDRDLKRHLGIGNSTGLGMAPFLVSHPDLLNNWMIVRETALARVRELPRLEEAKARHIVELADRAKAHLSQWQVPDAEHQQRIEVLKVEWSQVLASLEGLLAQRMPLDQLINFASELGTDCQELTVALILEPFGDLVDELTECMVGSPVQPLNSGMDARDLRDLISRNFDFALSCNFDDKTETWQFWYVSEEKQEPRLGLRFEEPGAELESPLDIARQVQALYRDLEGADGSLSAFLRKHPQHRAAVYRVQLNATHPYSEIQDNLICEDCKPIDMLRCKLSFFGAAKFDPKSDRWTRITLAQGAPLADELHNADDWWLPVFPA